ncbi:stress-induced protein sti1-like protein (ISS) [Planoprotostelium fungivorum]|uniref:Stress-induced protein sti1-like protein (ISS) n=1 Tax=Planoprotostelium fungivorum TaxID=1890364 RepID=A0A2P6MXH6_9EUKA|nr:stress-induced protein sti1-like protein (ISS) [Planoprotostelium fungivorum]
MSAAALEAKNQGNAAFSAGNYEEAVKHFTTAIGHDAGNHVLYSNRSAAYASLKNYQQALEDANQTVKIKPDWAKGYSRKGLALHYLGDLRGAIQSYEQGLKLEPTNQLLLDGLRDVKDALESESMGASDPTKMFQNMFSGDVFTKLKMNPKTAAYLNQPDYVNMINMMKANPSSIQMYLSDPRIMASLGVLMGIPMDFAQAPDAEPMETEAPPKPQEKPAEKQPEKPPASEEEKLSDEYKEKGNAAYKAKKFDEAIDLYTKSFEANNKNITALTNRAAVLVEQSKFDEAIADCEKAIEVGRANYADYKLIAKAFQRIGNVHTKTKKYDEAVEAYKKSLTEDRTPQTLDLLRKAEKLSEEKAKNDYVNPELSTQAKERGNDHFRNQRYPESIQEYTEAIKRNPKDHTLYSNRAASYTKLGEYNYALKDCEECIKIKPDFPKVYSRKGTAHYFMKEYEKALDAYDKGMKLDPSNSEMEEGTKRVMEAIQRQRSSRTPEEIRQEAMKNPEIVAILQDPVMNQILQDMQADPKAIENHLKNPMINAKFQKLVNAGIVQMG